VLTERLCDREKRYQFWQSAATSFLGFFIIFTFNLSSLCVKKTVHALHFITWAQNLHFEHGLEEAGLRFDLGGLHGPFGRRDDLARASMDGVRVKLDVLDEEAGVGQCLFGEDSALGDLLEGGCDRVFDVLQVLDALGVVENHVGIVSRGGSQGGRLRL
jgi:hypothetical protein